MTAYLIIFILLLVAELAYLRVAERFGITDCPTVRSSHTRPTVRGGGIVFYLGVMAWAVWSGFAELPFVLGLTMVAAVSFADDLRGMPVWLRLLVQIVAVGLMTRALLADPNVLLMAMWVFVGVAFLNAYNFMDGINGSAGLYSLVTLGTLAVLDSTDSFADPRLIWCSILATVIFCIFNVRVRARCFAGDVGSLSAGFIILYLMSSFIASGASLAWVVLVSVYGTDACLTLLSRLIRGHNIFRPHRMHAYQRLCNEMGLSHLVVSSAYALLQLVINAGAMLIAADLWIYLVVVEAVLVGGYVYIYSASRHRIGGPC